MQREGPNGTLCAHPFLPLLEWGQEARGKEPLRLKAGEVGLRGVALAAGKRPMEPTEVADLQRVIESSLRLGWNAIRHRARLIRDSCDVPFVCGSEARLGQVLLNLIVNAAHTIPEGNPEANLLRVATRAGPLGRVIVEISDTGARVEPDHLRRTFGPFFASLGGELQVWSAVGQGTTLRITLKAAVVLDATDQVVEPRLRALVIDDEPLLGLAIRRTLRKEHEVMVCTTAREGLARLTCGEAFDVVLCDLLMPQMTGMELYAELHELNPELARRIIFMSGGAFTGPARTFLDTVPNRRVDKPFDAQQLRAIVSAASGEVTKRPY